MRVLGGASGLNYTYFFRHENAYRDASQADDVIGGSKFAGEITSVRTRLSKALADDPTGFELKRYPSPR